MRFDSLNYGGDARVLEIEHHLDPGLKSFKTKSEELCPKPP